MATVAHLLPDMLQCLALRADSLPRFDATSRFLRFVSLGVTLDSTHTLLIRLSHRALRVDARGGIADLSADGAGSVRLAKNERLRLLVGHRRHASCLGTSTAT